MKTIQFQLLVLTTFFGINLGETAVGSRKQLASLPRLKGTLGDQSLVEHKVTESLSKTREERGTFKTPVISELPCLVPFLYFIIQILIFFGKLMLREGLGIITSKLLQTHIPRSLTPGLVLPPPTFL